MGKYKTTLESMLARTTELIENGKDVKSVKEDELGYYMLGVFRPKIFQAF